MQGLKQLWHSGEGPALVLSTIFCVITGIFMARILPVESAMGAIGVFFIYITVFVLVSGMFFKPLVKLYRRMRRRASSG